MWYRIFGFDSRSPPLVPHRSLMDPVRILPCHAALAQWQSACLVNRLQQSDSARRLSHGKGFAPAVRMDARRIGSLSRLRIPACSTALWVRLPPHPRHSAGSVDSMVHVGMICGVCMIIWLIRLMVRMAVSQTAGRGSTPLSATCGTGLPAPAMVRFHGDKRAVIDKFGDLGGMPETRTPQCPHRPATGAGNGWR